MNVYQRLILLVGGMSFGIVVFNSSHYRFAITQGIAILGTTIMLWFAAKSK